MSLVTFNENRERSVSRRAGEEEEGSLTFTRALNDTASILAPEGDTDRCPRWIWLWSKWQWWCCLLRSSPGQVWRKGVWCRKDCHGLRSLPQEVLLLCWVLPGQQESPQLWRQFWKSYSQMLDAGNATETPDRRLVCRSCYSKLHGPQVGDLTRIILNWSGLFLPQVAVLDIESSQRTDRIVPTDGSGCPK